MTGWNLNWNADRTTPHSPTVQSRKTKYSLHRRISKLLGIIHTLFRHNYCDFNGNVRKIVSPIEAPLLWTRHERDQLVTDVWKRCRAWKKRNKKAIFYQIVMDVNWINFFFIDDWKWKVCSNCMDCVALVKKSKIVFLSFVDLIK